MSPLFFLTRQQQPVVGHMKIISPMHRKFYIFPLGHKKRGAGLRPFRWCLRQRSNVLLVFFLLDRFYNFPEPIKVLITELLYPGK